MPLKTYKERHLRWDGIFPLLSGYLSRNGDFWHILKSKIATGKKPTKSDEHCTHLNSVGNTGPFSLRAWAFPVLGFPLLFFYSSPWLLELWCCFRHPQVIFPKSQIKKQCELQKQKFQKIVSVLTSAFCFRRRFILSIWREKFIEIVLKNQVKVYDVNHKKKSWKIR